LDFATVNFYIARSSALCPTPNLEDKVYVFISTSDWVAQLYPQRSHQEEKSIGQKWE
jgi:hypothetical protein